MMFHLHNFRLLRVLMSAVGCNGRSKLDRNCDQACVTLSASSSSSLWSSGNAVALMFQEVFLQTKFAFEVYEPEAVG